MRYLFSFLTLSCFALTPTFGQIVGGEVKTLHRFEGASFGDELGGAVASAGDVDADGYPDIIIGYKVHYGSGSEPGYVDIYSGRTGALLSRFGNGSQIRFGASVASVGDINADGHDDVIIGADDYDAPGLSSSGAAFVYSGLDGSLLYQFNGGTAGEHSGNSVAGAGDVNADGYPDIIIGASSAYVGSFGNGGYAQVYSGFDGSLLHRWEGTSTYAKFGGSVDGVGDVDLDGYDDLIVGSEFADSIGGTNSGSAYVYSGQTGALLYRFDGTEYDSRLGYSVSGAGDANGDGYADVIVGAYRATSAWGVFRTGSAALFSGLDGSLLHRFDGEGTSDQMGWSVSEAGDVNADGYDDVVVGANLADPGGRYNAGSAYIYSGRDGSLLIKWTRALDNDQLGYSVAAAGDMNHDGYDDVIVAAPEGDPWGRFDAGTVEVVGLAPYITASEHHVSAASANTLEFGLSFPLSTAHYEYRILLSSAMGPSFYGVDIPLLRGPMAVNSYNGSYPFPTTTNMHGTLNWNAQAMASCGAPAGSFNRAIGYTMYFAAIVNPPGGVPTHSSIALPVTILP